MKTNLNTIFFRYSDHQRKSAPLSGTLTVKKAHYDRKMTLIPRQLLYESTTDDVFWVLHTKFQEKKQLECLG